MKIMIISVMALLLVVGCSGGKKQQDTVQAPEPMSWHILEEQTQTFASGVQNHDVRVLHKLDHAVTGEMAGLQKLGSSLAVEKKQQLESLLADLVKQAARAHHSGHAGDWEDAVAAQKQFAEDVSVISVLVK
jgi:hypothetical protein